MKHLLVCVLMVCASFQIAGKEYFKDEADFIQQHLKQNKYALDTSASAIVLYEKYTYDLTGSSGILVLRVRKVIKILNKNGIKYSDVEIPVYYSNTFHSNIKQISGTTYNIKGESVSEESLETENIFKGTSDHIKEKKFSMPAVHEGSVIDYTYEIEENLTRDFGRWNIQSDIPKLFSEMEVRWPLSYNLILLQQAASVYKMTDSKKDDEVLPDAYMYEETNFTNFKKWVRKNVKATDNEPFVSSIDNYKEKTQVFVRAVHTGAGMEGQYDTWEKINKFLLESPKFYKAILRRHSAVEERAIAFAHNDSDKVAIAKRVFSYVRDSVTMQGNGGMWIEQDPAEVFEHKTGTAAEINMLLIDMLQYAGIDCNPVILSTKNNGKVTDLYPDLQRFNYVVCEAAVNGEVYYLDASKRYLPFGLLPEWCYNGYARVIKKDGIDIDLQPNMVKERSLFKIVTTSNSIDDYTINCKYFYGQEAAMRHREEWNKDTGTIRSYISGLLKKSHADVYLKNYEVQNLSEADKQLVLEFNLKLDWGQNSQNIYLSPFFYQYFDANTFTAAERKYPVEMPCSYSVVYDARFQLPKGYATEDTLTSLRIKYEDNVQSQYIEEYDTLLNSINVNVNTRILRTAFSKDEYPSLKEFFDKMITEQQKTIAIKKR